MTKTSHTQKTEGLFEILKQVNVRVFEFLEGDKKNSRRKVADVAARFKNEPPLNAALSLIDTLHQQGLFTDGQALDLQVETKAAFKCYAAQICEFRHGKKGWPDRFDEPKRFPGRMAKAAALKDMIGAVRDDKPWLNGQPRLIFVSDMGDALSADVDFPYLLEEIINQVTSKKGARHVWLWVTKRPKRMAEFANWLKDQGIPWPDNLVPMTTVTGAATAYRVNDLREVPAKMRGLSVEPLWDAVTLDLTGIDWVIVGGESGSSAEPFHVEWALSLREQCQKAGAKFFLKQLGAKPLFQGEPIALQDPHGGEWDEWPEAEWRVRELPEFGQLVPAAVIEAPAVIATIHADDLAYRTEREALVTRGLHAGLEAAKALSELETYKDGVLWKAEHKTFRHYCQAKWGYAKSHTYRLMECGRFLKRLEAHVEADPQIGERTVLPMSECQLRPILALPEESRVAAWMEVVGTDPVGSLTGAEVAKKVEGYRPRRVRAFTPLPAPVEVVVQEAPPPDPAVILTELETRLLGHPKWPEIAPFIGSIRELVRAA